ncbi:MAG: serine protease [Chthoniobacteraceae bacterium]
MLHRPRFFLRCLWMLAVATTLVPRSRAASSDLGGSVALQSLPGGWAPIDSAAPAVGTDGPLPLPKLLLLAHPSAAGNAESVSIVQFPSPAISHLATPSSPTGCASYLAGYVSSTGWRAGEPSIAAAHVANASLTQVTIDATSTGTAKRRFTLLTISQPTQTLRLLFQQSPDDEKGTADLQAFLSQLTIKNQPIVAALSAAKTLAFSDLTQGLKSEASTPDSVTPDPALLSQITEVTQSFDQSADIAQQHRNGLVLMEGKEGMGSGFVCQMDHAQYLITNAHVMAGNPGVRITSLDGTALQPGAAGVAIGRDIFRMALPGSQSGSFELLEDVDSHVKIGDDIAVLGNSEGAGVVRALRGRVVGIGPQLVEVDAPFVPGNSGSPIVHLATGKVIGIATYLIEKKVAADGSGSVSNNIRRFGYRLDGKLGWQPVNWPVFSAQAASVEGIQSLSKEFIKLFRNAHDHQSLNPEDYQNPAIQRALISFEGAAQNGHVSKADLEEAARRLLADLRIATQNDIAAFNTQNSYDYFRREVQDESRLRNDLYKALTDAMNMYMH